VSCQKIEYIYYKWIAFLTITVFLLSIVGIWWEFDKVIVSIVLLVSLIASHYIGGCYALKDNSNLALIALAAFLIQSSSTFLVLFIPTFSYDEIAYSVSLPKHYAIAHKFYYVDDYGPYSAFPQNYETLTSVSLLFFGSPIVSKVINYILGFGMVLAANRMAIQCGVSGKVSILAGVFVGCSVAFITSLPIAKNDIFNSFFQVWAIVVLIAYIGEQRVFFAGVIGALIGTAIGTKYNSLIFSIIPIGFFFTFTHLSSMLNKEKLCRYSIFVFFLIVAAFPWYLRNYIEFQNPFYPAANSFFVGHNNFNQTYIDVFKEIFFDDIVDFSWDSGTTFTFFIKHIAGFGVVVSILGMLGIMLSWRNKGERRFLSLILIALIGLTLRFGFWEPRYNITLLVLTSVFAVVFGDRVFVYMKSRYHKFNINLAAAIFIIIFSMLGFVRGETIYKSVQYDYLVNKDKFLQSHVPYWKVANFLNNNTPKNSKIGVGFGANQMFYYLDRPYYHFHPLTEKGDLLNMSTPNDFLSLLNKQNIDYLAISSCCSYGHIEGKTPVLSLFMKNFYEGIAILNEDHAIEKIGEIDDVIIYKRIMVEN